MEEFLTIKLRGMSHTEIKAEMQKCLDKAEIHHMGSDYGRKVFREEIRPAILKAFREAADELHVNLYPTCPWCGHRF
jgi:hypothetical protein